MGRIKSDCWAAPCFFLPMYAQANMGHPSREEGLVLAPNASARAEFSSKPKPNRLA
jgi:hypothetical protein